MFKGPRLDFLIVAVQDGALRSRALNTVHVDRSRTYGLETYLITKTKRKTEKNTDRGHLSKRASFIFAKSRPAWHGEQRDEHSMSHNTLHFSSDKYSLFCLQRPKDPAASTLGIFHTSLQTFCCFVHSDCNAVNLGEPARLSLLLSSFFQFRSCDFLTTCVGTFDGLLLP